MIVDTRGILFDMDGVLVSSIASVNRCWRRWAIKHHVPNAETITIPHGTRAVDIIRLWTPQLDVNVGLAEIVKMELEDLGDIEVLPGARALLESLPPALWAIVTSATSELLKARLEAAGLPVPAHIVSADMVKEGKPHPEPYLKGAQLLGLDPGECIVAEDAPNGVASGLAAGARVIGVLGTQDEAALRREGATWLVDSLANVTATSSATSVQLSISAR